MKEALTLAKKGLGCTSPNPAVGCLIVNNGKIVGRGYHEKCGEAHAEVNALNEAGENAQGADMYVTLEPCCCQGRTGPCTEAITEAGVARVLIASKDLNPKVAGKGIAQLERAGIIVESGLLEEESKKMNEMYEKFITTKMPFVLVKAALSADGKMAANDGSSKWITGEDSRRVVHDLRGQVDAIMVGVKTVIKDDPELTCRTGGKNPRRIILDSKLEIPSTAKVLENCKGTVIITSKEASLSRADAMRQRGIDVRMVDTKEGRITLRKLLRELGTDNITSVMIEGGGELIGSAFEEGVVDKVMFFIAPKIIGGRDATHIGGGGISNIKDAMHLERVEMKHVGDDFLLIGYPSK